MYGDELRNKYFTTSSRRQGTFKYNINKREKKVRQSRIHDKAPKDRRRLEQRQRRRKCVVFTEFRLEYISNEERFLNKYKAKLNTVN